MTTLGKVFVFIQFVLAICLLGVGVGLYANHTDWEAKIKEEAKRISELAAERDRAEMRWNNATNRLQQVEAERPFRLKRYADKLALMEKGTVPAGAQPPQAFVTELVFVKDPNHTLPFVFTDPGILDITGGKPVQNRGTNLDYYTKIEEELDRYNRANPKGLIATEQEKVAQLLEQYNRLGLEINGDDKAMDLPTLRGLRKERSLQDDARTKALQEQEYLKPLLANRYAETVLLLKRQNSLLARKAELEKIGVAAK